MGNTAIEPSIAPGSGLDATVITEECDADGRRVSRTGWRDGLPQGETCRYAADGTLQLQARMDRGQLCGHLRIYDERGELIRDASYLAGQQHGDTLSYRDGRLASLERYENGLLHGESLIYAESGGVAARRCYVAGRLHGLSVALHEGVAIRTTPYVEGRLEGEVREYLPDGQLVWSGPYRSNLLHGKACRYHADGGVSAERLYIEGKPQEPWRVVTAPAGQAARSPATGRLEKWIRG